MGMLKKRGERAPGSSVLRTRKKLPNRIKLKGRPQSSHSFEPDTSIISQPCRWRRQKKKGDTARDGTKLQAARRCNRTPYSCWLSAKARKFQITRRKYRFRLFAFTVEIPSFLAEDTIIIHRHRRLPLFSQIITNPRIVVKALLLLWRFNLSCFISVD